MNPIDGIETQNSKSFTDVLANKVVKETDKEKETFLGWILGPKFDELVNKVTNVFAVLTGKETASTETQANVNTTTPEVKVSQTPESRISILWDMSHLRSQYPKEAWSRCNNPAGISWNENFANPKRGTLAYDLQEAGIDYYEAPGGRWPWEDWSYVWFPTMEKGLEAMRLLWERSAKQWKTIAKRLSNYAADAYSIPGIDGSMRFDELTSQQKNDLLMKQIKQESPGLYAELNDRNIDFQTLNIV
jgi:hypothetical protein